MLSILSHAVDYSSIVVILRSAAKKELLLLLLRAGTMKENPC